MEIVRSRVELYSHVKVLNDILSVVTNVLSVCRLWPQPRPCHSKTTGHSSFSDRLLEAVAAPPHHWSLGGWRGRGENPPGHHASHIRWIVSGTSVTPSVSHPLHPYVQTLLWTFFKSVSVQLVHYDMLTFWFLWFLQLSAAVQLPSGENFHLRLHLLHPIVPEHSSFRILSTKVVVV